MIALRPPVTILGAHSASPPDRPFRLRRRREERQVVGPLEVADCLLLPLSVGEVRALAALVAGGRGWDRAARPLLVVAALEVRPCPCPFVVGTLAACLAAYWVVASCPPAAYLAASHSDPEFTRVPARPVAVVVACTSGRRRHHCLRLAAYLGAYWAAAADYTAGSGPSFADRRLGRCPWGRSVPFGRCTN